MIQFDGLSKTYGTRSSPIPALRDVSLTMGAGVWGIVGPNGAGKTTLLGLTLGFLKASSGSVALEGRSPRRYLRRHGAAYLPERFSLPGNWPVRPALLALARLDGGDRHSSPGQVDAVIERMGLAEYVDRPIGQLSRGLNQRVGLAQMLLSDRQLVVLDEPTEGLDPLWRVRFREVVDELRGSGRTVLLASHDLSEVERLADRVIVLRDGRLTETIENRRTSAGQPQRFWLTVDAPVEQIEESFPGAVMQEGAEKTASAIDGGADVAGTERGRTFQIGVADAGELSQRLAALIDGGGIVRAVVPASYDLEEQVRQRLEDR